MALQSGTVYFNTNSTHIKGYVYWEEQSTDVNNNTSQVYAKLVMYRDNTGYTTYGTGNFYLSIDGQAFNATGHSYSFSDSTGQQETAGTATVGHNADGTRTISISYSGNGDSGFTITSGSFNITLTTIPRASTVSSSVSWTAGTQDLSVNLNVASSSFHHSIQVFVDNPSGTYGSYIAQRDNIGSSTTITFTQTEITAMYNQIQGYEWRDAIVRVFTYDSNGNQIGSYQDKYGYCYAIPTATATIGTNNIFNISDLPTLTYTLNNYTTGSAGGFTYDFTFTLGSFSKTFSALTAQTGTIGFTSTDVTNMYNATPNSNVLSGTVKVQTKYNGVNTEDGSDGTHTNMDVTNITANVTGSNPTFTNTGVTYLDTNSTTTGITGNNQYIIQNNSTLRVTIPLASKATAINGATMSSYSATVNGVTKTGAWSSTADVTIDFGTVNASSNVTLTINAIDSRGNKTPQSITINIVPYSSPVIVSKAQRLNNFEATTTISLSGSISRLTVGSDKNTVINQIADPTSQPTLTQNTATSTLPANTYYVKYTWYNSVGETLSGSYSIPSTVIASSNVSTVTITIPAKPSLATGAKIYVGTSSSTLHYQGTTATTTYTLSSYNSGGASIPTTNTTSQMQYRYKDSSLSTYSAWDSFTFSLTNGNYTATSETLTLDNTKSWDVQIQVIDKITTAPTPVQLSVGIGQPVMFIDITKKSIGINQFPQNSNSLELTGDLYINGNIGSTGSATLANGSNIVSVTENTPLSITSLKGKTLTNLLGNRGSFEVSLTPYNWTTWFTAGSASLAVDSSTCTTGNYSLKITSTASGSGEAYDTYQNLIDPTKYYVVVGDAKNYNASGGVGVGFYNIGNASQAVTVSTTTSTSWTPVFVRIQPSQLTGVTNFQIYGGYVSANASGQYGWVDGVRFYEITQAEYNAIGSMTAQQVASKYPYVDNAQGIINPTIDYNGNRMVVQTTLHSNKDQSVYDELFIDTDGKLKKRQWFKELYLDGGENWKFSADLSGFKEIVATINNSDDTDSYFGNPSYSILIRPDGYIMKKNSPASNAPNQYDFSTSTLNTIFIDVPDYYTGWGESYSPYQGEVNTFMYGWKEYDGGTNGADGKGTYSGSNRNWCRMNLYNGTYVDGTSAQPSSLAPTNTPFRLIYQLPTAQIVPIDPTGLILLPTGNNTVTLKQGIVVKERMKPVLYNGSMWVNTMSIVSGTKLWDSMFSHPCKTILKIEKTGGIDDTANWTMGSWSSGGNDVYGQQRATIPTSLFDTTVDYFVTYEVQYGSSMIADQMGITYPQSLRGISDYTLSTLVSIENKLDNLDSTYAKRANEDWISLSLFNGWVSYSQTGDSNWAKPAFYKDNMGIVHVKGLISSGTINATCATLPAGYRPKDQLIRTCVTGDNSVQRMDVDPAGNITVVAGSNGFASLDGLSFRAGTDW